MSISGAAQSIAEAWAGPVTDFAAFCNVDTAKKSAWLQSAMEIAGIGVAVADVRGLALSILPPPLISCQIFHDSSQD